MERVKRWWSGVDRPRRILLAGLLLLFVSQFFTSGEGRAYGLAGMTNTAVYTGMYSYETPMIGWRLHPLAVPGLLLLALAFLTSLHRRRGFARWIWWAAVPVALLAVAPFSPAHLGGVLALAGLAAVIWAAVATHKVRRRERDGAQPAP